MSILFETNKCHHAGPLGAEGPGQLPPPLNPALTRTVNLALVLYNISVIPVIAIIKPIKLLISGFLKILVLNPNFQGGICPFCPHHAVAHDQHLYEINFKEKYVTNVTERQNR